MSTKIIPRWEWRTFDEDLKVYKEKLSRFNLFREVESSENYLISRHTQVNCKLRNELLDIKMPLRFDKQKKLEQWTVFAKYSFPLPAENVAGLCMLLQVKLNWLDREEYQLAEFLEEIVADNRDIYNIPVSKVRQIYKVDQVQLEYSQVQLADDKYDTIAIEGTDQKKIIMLCEELGLENNENINYLKAMKRMLFQNC